MESKVIKIGNENYRWLLNIASILQRQRGRPISFDETITSLKEGKQETLQALYKEMKAWEKASIKDENSFFKKHNL